MFHLAWTHKVEMLHESLWSNQSTVTVTCRQMRGCQSPVANELQVLANMAADINSYPACTTYNYSYIPAAALFYNTIDNVRALRWALPVWVCDS